MQIQTKDLFYKEWVVENPKASILLVHGLGEHVMRYEHFAQFFNQKGYNVVGRDRIGHGQSPGKRGHAPNFPFLLDEIEFGINQINASAPDQPIIVYGHSMGGILVLSYLIQKKPNIAAVIATGPSIELVIPPPAILKLFGSMMAGVFPTYTQSNGINPKDVCSDPEVVKKYIDDPLVHNQISAKMGTDLLNAIDLLASYSGSITTPTLIMHGKNDAIASYKGSEKFSNNVKGPVDLKIWDGLHHEIHNEASQQQVFEFTLEWITKTVSPIQ